MRILVVEDDPILGAIWVDILGDAEADVAGHCPSVARAMAEIEGHLPAVAMLDIHLLDGTSFLVAHALTERRVPFFSVSSCDPHDPPTEFRPRPLPPFPLTDDHIGRRKT